MKKPLNVVFILADDMGAWAMHCAGNDEIVTPNLDRIARNGMRFENFFCASPVCSPARASIMTGTIPSAHGVHDWIVSGNVDRERLGKYENEKRFANETVAYGYLDGIPCYTDLLAENGYTCALSGKWHMGDSLRPQHGFSRWYTIARGGAPYFHPDMVENGKITIENEYITDLITQNALKNLDELHQEGKPFYLSVHYTAPHSPWEREQHKEEHLSLYDACPFHSTPDLPLHPWTRAFWLAGDTPEKRRSNLTGYYAAITAMDECIGRILDRLETLGEAENTLVIFTADNGMSMGHHGIWGKGNGTFPLNMYDSAVKVPMLAMLPGTIGAGRVVSSMHSHYDIMPTLIDFLGIDTPLPKNLPGRSFADVLLGCPRRSPGHVVVFDEYGATRMIRTDRVKYVARFPFGPDELYDLEHDPEETVNLVRDPAWQETKQQLRLQLFGWFNQYADPAVDGTREPVLGNGQLAPAGEKSGGKKTFMGDFDASYLKGVEEF